MDQGETQGLEALYRLHRADLQRFLIARTGDPGEAEDILQELWIKLSQTAAMPIANGRAYLYRMAQNLVVDRLRAQHRRMRRDRSWSDTRTDYAENGAEPADIGQQTAEDRIIEREETALLASALATLPGGARRAFELHKIDGLSHAEVAAHLGISKSGVEKHMAVAMKYLRRALKD